MFFYSIVYVFYYKYEFYVVVYFITDILYMFALFMFVFVI